MDRLCDEISAYKGRDIRVNSIFLGGGTPSLLTPDELRRIMAVVKDSFILEADLEFTAEANPGTLSSEKLDAFIECGVNRLSMGLQSIHQNELKILGRIHNFEDFVSSYKLAREKGIGNINLDLMYGIPLQTESSFKETLEAIVSYSPEHISAYALKIEPGTVFFKNKEKLLLPDEDSEYNMYKLAVQTLAENDYCHYEISNYAKKGFEARHNIKYWNADDYIGFGVSAHSCIKQNRYAVIDETSKYSDIILNDLNEDYYFETESLSEKEFSEEYIMMRLRLNSGLSPKEYKEKFFCDIPDKYIKRMFPFIQSGHIINSDKGFSLSDDGMYVSNYILSEILDLE